MTDRNDILRQIEEAIGDMATQALAEAMFYELKELGGIDFDAHDGFFFVRDGRGETIGWNDALEAAQVQVED